MHRSTLIFLTPKTSRSLVAVQKHPCRWSGISSFIAPNGDQRWFDMRSLGQLFKNWWVNTSSRILHLVDENRLRRIMHYKNGYFCQSLTSHWGYWLSSFHLDFHLDQIDGPNSSPFKARKSSEILAHQLLCTGSQRVVSSPNFRETKMQRVQQNDHHAVWTAILDVYASILHAELPHGRFNMKYN